MASLRLFVFATCVAQLTASSVTPVQKVLDMLGEMKAKGEKQMEAEQKIFADYKEWVSDETTRLGFSIKTASSDIEKLTAFINKADNDVDDLGKAIAQLDDLTAAKEDEKHAATEIRKADHAEFVTNQKDLAESVDALGRAITTLENQAFSRDQAEMLLQRMAVATKGMRPVLAAFLQEKTGRDNGAPEVAAYEFQSDGIISMLQGLLKKFEAELSDVETAETNKAQNYDMNMIQLSDLIAHTKADRESKAETKANTAAASAKAKGDLAETNASKAADERTLADMSSVFEDKAGTFKQNQEVRQMELDAIQKAIEIISAPNVADSYAGHINLAQVPARMSLLQMHSSSKRVVAKQQAAEYLKKRARSLSSKVLASLAMEVSANPFAKVVDMIKSLISKLKEEAAAEADHKAWCDEQLKSNKLKRNKKTSESEKLMAEIEQLGADIDTMAKDIATLLQEQKDLTSAMGEATEDRQKEKAENVATIADAQAGSAAVKSALVVLRDFYASQSFIQQVPEMAAYKGMQNAKGGVVGMLEVIVSDFVRLEAETTAAENTAQGEYDAFMSDAKADKEQKHKAVVKLELEKDQAEFDKSNSKKSLVGVTAELDMATAYFEELKPQCVQIHVSYEERVARRKEEIQALKEAYNILDQKGE